MQLLAPLAALVATHAVAVAVAAGRLVRGVPLLTDLVPPPPATWPRVSVIVPACNEAGSIEGAMRSRLAEGYPNVEYLLVDDRSTDGTGAIVDRLATEDDRVRAIHVEELPAGWLGKVHAMEAGLAHATGEWILFSDADVHHEPGALARIVAWAEAEGRDHVALFPSVWSSSFALDVMMNAMMRMFAVFSRAWKVADPRSRAALGGGNFNLVRRSALDRAGGLSPLRLEVVDDAGLGQLVKWAGARQGVLNARGKIGLFYYRSVREAVVGMEKNAFAALGRFSVARFVARLGALAVLELGAFVAVAGGESLTRVVAGGAIVLGAAVHLWIARWLGRPLLPSLLAPIGIAMMFFGAIRSMLLTIRRGGVEWRGTHYSLAALRRGRRWV